MTAESGDFFYSIEIFQLCYRLLGEVRLLKNTTSHFTQLYFVSFPCVPQLNMAALFRKHGDALKKLFVFFFLLNLWYRQFIIQRCRVSSKTLCSAEQPGRLRPLMALLACMQPSWQRLQSSQRC